MIRILIFLLSILFLSCSSTEKKSKSDEIAFRENREAYNDIIIDFEENKLHKIYPNLETNEAYHHLLKDILDRKIEIVDLKTKNGERIFKNALKKELQCLTDSVWIDENLSEVCLKEKCWNPETDNYKYKTIEVASFVPRMDKDSILNSFKNRVSFNDNSNYVNTLKAVKPKNDFLTGYIQMKEAAGDIAFYIITENMIRENVNFNKPIIKRIFITEIIYN